MSFKKVIKRTGKILLYILGSVMILLCLSIAFINSRPGKKFVRNKIQSYLSNKIKTKFSIGSIDYSLPNWIEIKNVYLEDQKKDTLIYGERIFVNLNMIKLISGSTYIRELSLKNIVARINRNEKDSFFNYQFLVDAFSPGKPATQTDKDTVALKMSLDKLSVDHISFKFNDKNAGSDFDASIKNLEATLNKFQPDRLNFGIKKTICIGC